MAIYCTAWKTNIKKVANSGWLECRYPASKLLQCTEVSAMGEDACGTQTYLSERIATMTCGILNQDHAVYNNSVPSGKQPLVCYGFVVESGKLLVRFSGARDSICCCLVTKLCASFCNCMDGSPRSSLSSVFPRQNTGGVAISFSGVSPWPRDRNYISCIAGNLFFTEPPGKSLDLPVWYFSVVKPVDWLTLKF